jgi:hypothetical protein
VVSIGVQNRLSRGVVEPKAINKENAVVEGNVGMSD